ncbi:MAG: hypothetical protein ACR2MP_03005 [Streptosporangiaceae bacterium]
MAGGNLDEGEPHGLPGSYLNGVHELRPLPYAEAGYGNPESGQTMINVTNGKIIRLLVDDEPLDIRYGELRAHERTLDFRAGVLRRRADWASPAGCTVRVSSALLVSLVQRSIAAICYEVEALDSPVRVVVQSELVANEQLPPPGSDPRAAAVLEAPLAGEEHAAQGARAGLVYVTRRSGLRVAAVMDHVVHGPPGTAVLAESFPHLGRATVMAALGQGQRLRLVKFVAYGWSASRSLPAVRDQAGAALAGARRAGWDGLMTGQRSYLDAFWARSDGQLDWDPEIQQAVRFALFHVLQAGARAEGTAIPAKGLTGPGYDGHCFWNSEAYVLPVLTHVAPGATADALRWRHSTLPKVTARARQLGCEARHSRGGPSPAKSAPDTGQPAPPPSTSAPTSPTRSSATSRRAATSRSNAPSASNCWRKPPGCGAPSAISMPAPASGSTGSPARMSTAPSPTTTSRPT